MIDSNELKKRINVLFSEYNVAGMAVAVTDKKGIVFSECLGVESVERPILKVEPQTLFKIASITKMTTGLVIMKLYEEGLLDIDAPVKKYVPWLKLSRPEAEDTMTLRHILCHGSGLSSEIRKNGPKDERYLEAQLRSILPELEMTSLPGEEKHLYSNYGFVLASYVAQTVTGVQYSKLATEKILIPLGMTHSFYDLNVYSTYPIALPHVEDANGNLVVKHIISSDATRFGSGEMFSNVLDLSRRIRLFLNGGIADNGSRILSESSINEMLTPQIKRDGEDYHGLAVHIRKFGDKYIKGHTGYLPPYRASLFFDTEREIGAVVLLNTNCDPIRDDILRMIF